MADVMIRVPAHVRDRLARIAEARGTSVRALMEELAFSTLTPQEREDRVARTRAYMAEHFGVVLTGEDREATRRLLDDLFPSPEDRTASGPEGEGAGAA